MSDFERVETLFYRGSGLVGTLIKWQTRSPYSHVALRRGDTVIEAREFRGVIKRPFNEEQDGAAERYHVVLPLPAGILESVNDLAWEWAEERVGCPYDYPAVLRFISRRSAEVNENWFCSEFAFGAWQYAGAVLLDRTEMWEVAPGLLIRAPDFWRVR